MDREGQEGPRGADAEEDPEVSTGDGSTQSSGDTHGGRGQPGDQIPRGRPKSGRIWKDPNKKRFSAMVKDRPLRTSWEQKMKARQEKRLMKDFAQHLQAEKQRQKEEKKQRRQENLKRRLENERKAEIVQVIRNPSRLKRAKKKQLRGIEKRDTLKLVQRVQSGSARGKGTDPGPE
ncbi:coiled-coil domain-containing protein 86 [Rhinatrema bivittatum]|uniref:coiled-coil domain-containing protein 86 n=1 Tax=Rhinatrema bivittatum TaxID=194408 RepID=UPI0011282454|nr:coiled-coil domain-containing protein 86 [Rhinatrema bivittatum]